MILPPSLAPLPVFFLFALAAPAVAQESGPSENEVAVSTGEVSGNSGRVAINIAAGSQNQQIGSAIVAIGELPITVQGVEQHSGAPEMADGRTAVAIGAQAFSNNSGMLSVNIAAGNQNQSANLAVLTVGTIGVVSDQMLAQTSAPSNPAGRTAPGLDTPNDSIAIDDAAFSGNSGLVQINLVGGERNSSANTFALSVSAGGKP